MRTARMLNIKRYLRLLQAYPNRRRRRNANRWIDKICDGHWKVVELGCGSGLTAARISGPSYVGIDRSRGALARARRRLSSRGYQFIEADPRHAEIPAADLVIFLGLVEKLTLREFSDLLGRIPAKRILFSFSEPPSGELYSHPLRLLFRGLPHHHLHHTDVIAELLEQHGFKKREVRRSFWLGPGKIVFAERPRYVASANSARSVAQPAP